MSAAKQGHAGRRWGGGSGFFLRVGVRTCITKAKNRRRPGCLLRPHACRSTAPALDTQRGEPVRSRQVSPARSTVTSAASLATSQQARALVLVLVNALPTFISKGGIARAWPRHGGRADTATTAVSVVAPQASPPPIGSPPPPSPRGNSAPALSPVDGLFKLSICQRLQDFDR